MAQHLCSCGKPFKWSRYSSSGGSHQLPCPICGNKPPPRRKITPEEFAKGIGSSEILTPVGEPVLVGGPGQSHPGESWRERMEDALSERATCIICNRVVNRECEIHPGLDNIKYLPHGMRHNPKKDR